MFKLIADVWPFSLFRRTIHLPHSPPLVPEFEIEGLVGGGFVYNPDFYVVEKTAKELMMRFNALAYYLNTFDDATPAQWWLKFADGFEICAGNVGRFFALYPEDKYPGAAFHFAVSLIAADRAQKIFEKREALRGE